MVPSTPSRSNMYVHIVIFYFFWVGTDVLLLGLFLFPILRNLLASPQMMAPLLLAFVHALLNRRLKLIPSFPWMMYPFNQKVPLLPLHLLQSMVSITSYLVLVTDLTI